MSPLIIFAVAVVLVALIAYHTPDGEGPDDDWMLDNGHHLRSRRAPGLDEADDNRYDPARQAAGADRAARRDRDARALHARPGERPRTLRRAG